MEHVVQLGINIDDEAIRKGVEADATKEIVKNITKDLENVLFENHYSSKPYSVSYTGEKIIKDWFDEHKDEIIQAIVRSATNRIMKTKRIKEYIIDHISEDIGKG